MLNRKNFYENFFHKTENFKLNIRKTTKIFKNFYSDYNNYSIPLLESFKQNYDLDFSDKTVKKFSKYENIFIFGMGGSVLGTKCIYSFFEKKIKKKLFFFDNLDSNLYLNFKKIKKVKNSCFIIVSKSGETLETIANLSFVFKKTLPKNKIIIITEIKDNSLLSIANKFDAEIIEHKDFIGGRYSVFSEVSMLPAALMGLDINKFKNLDKLLNNKFFVSSLIKNTANIYTLYKKGICNSVILNYDSNLNDLSQWYRQLVGESLGKQGKGITPILSLAPKDHHSMMQLYLDGPKDKFYTFFTSSNKKENKNITTGNIIPDDMNFLKKKNIKSILKAQSKATINIFKLKNIPFRQFIFNKEKEQELGEVLTFFVLETLLLARLLNVDPFNQPAVEQIKIETQKILLK